MRLEVKGNDYFSVKPEIGMEFKYIQPLKVKTNLSVGLTASYENEIGKLQDKNQARVTLRGVVDKPGIAAEIFTALAHQNINVDMIIQNVGHDGTTNLGFTVPQNELDLAKETMQKLSAAKHIEFDDAIVKVSVIGVGMKSHSGVACLAFETLAKEGINIQMISTSEIKISMIVDQKYGELAVRVLHDAYKLDK